MNEWQLFRELRSRLRALKFPGSMSRVFGDSVVVSSTEADPALDQYHAPIVVLRTGAAVADPERQEATDLIEYQLQVDLYVANDGDSIGEYAALGGHVVGDESTEGRGILDIQEHLLEALRLLEEKDGITLQLRVQSATDAIRIEERVSIVRRTYVFVARTSVSRTYPRPEFFYGVVGGDKVTLRWTAPPARSDFHRLELRRSLTATPPASISSGVSVPFSGESVVDTVGVGKTASYSIFAIYDDVNATPSSDERISEAATATVTT